MAWVIVGLGNPGDEYDSTRHNAGRIAVMKFAKDIGIDTWKEEKKTKATVARGALGKELVVCVLPDTFMNKSGNAVAHYVKSQKAAERMIVAYDDLDLPLGKIKMSFDRGSGGHKGVESVTRAVKTKKFTRIRIGVSPATPSGTIKKPQGEKDVLDFILSKFKATEVDELKKVIKRASEAAQATIENGPLVAMNGFNGN